MDGVRAYWNGEVMISRQGRLVSCPEWFISTLPANVTLDGELWIGHGTSYHSLMEVLKSRDGNWRNVGYYVYDLPSSLETYEIRMQEMEKIGWVLPNHVRVVSNIQCKGLEHLRSYLESIAAIQGEGIMLRKPQTKNELGHTSSLIKVKALLLLLTTHEIGI